MAGPFLYQSACLVAWRESITIDSYKESAAIMNGLWRRSCRGRSWSAPPWKLGERGQAVVLTAPLSQRLPQESMISLSR